MSRRGGSKRLILTEKHLTVLDTFFRMGGAWLANPADVSREAHGGITKTWAAKVCTELAKAGLIETKMTRSRKKSQDSAHYKLRPGPNAFWSTALAYFAGTRALRAETWSSWANSLLSSTYMREEFTDELVRAMLIERRVSMSLGVQAPPELLREEDEFAGRRRRTFFLRLPLATRTGLNMESLARAAVNEADTYSQKFEPAARAWLTSWALEHYRDGELRRLVHPLRALCEVSPRALETFLLPWEVHDSGATHGGGSGFPMIDHVVFRMVFDAVADLSDARDVPQGSAVTFAEVCPENGGCVEGMPMLLQLTWGENKLIGYAAGFDTSHDDYGPGEDDSGPMALILSGKPPEEWTAEMLFGSDAGPVEVTRNPENAWVKVDWGERRVLAFMDPELTGLERSLGYRFRDRRLLAEATTHSSLLNEPRGADRAANQRLAHLGDAVVELAVREALFKRFPAAAKGDLAAAKVPIVRDSGLAKVACAKEIGEFLDRGRGRPKEGDNDTILAEAFEALVGAVYLDSDLEEAARIVERMVTLPTAIGPQA